MGIKAMVPNIGTNNVDKTTEFFLECLDFEVINHQSDSLGLIRSFLKNGPAEITVFRLSQEHSVAPDQISLYINTDDIVKRYFNLQEKVYRPVELRLTFYSTMEFQLIAPDGYKIQLAQETREIQMRKSDLIRIINERYDELYALSSTMSFDCITKPGVQGKWSVKDIIAHLTVWKRRFLQWISISEQGAIPETPAPGYTWEQIHQLNEESYQQYKDVEYQYALQQFRESYLDIIDYINKLDEEELNNPKLHPFTNGQPIWVDIGFNTFDHYRAHTEAIKHWLRKNYKMEGIEDDVY